MIAEPPNSDLRSLIEAMETADADDLSVQALVKSIDPELGAILQTPSDPDQLRPQLSIAIAEELSAGLLECFKGPEAHQANHAQLNAVAIKSTTSPRHSPLESDESSPRSDIKDLSHTHWMTRAMSVDCAKMSGAAHVEQNIRVHWIGLSLSTASKHENSAVVAMEQWLNSSESESCTPLASVPVDHRMRRGATGERTKLELYPLCSVPGPPPLTTAEGGSSANIGNADLLSNAVTYGSQGNAERGEIHDSTAELLRPLLRQWLNDTMGLMVEKALAAEVAENARG